LFYGVALDQGEEQEASAMERVMQAAQKFR
jgi:hypothetical protein